MAPKEAHLRQRGCNARHRNKVEAELVVRVRVRLTTFDILRIAP